MELRLVRWVACAFSFVYAAAAGAQCADVFVYMPRPFLETGNSLELYVGTSRITTLTEGTRVKGTVCGPDPHLFEVVYTDLGVNAKEEIVVGDDSEIYLKASFTPGVSLPLFKRMDLSKGRRDLRSNAKFTSEIELVQYDQSAGTTAAVEAGDAPAATASTHYGDPEPAASPRNSSGGGFGSIRKVYEHDGFLLELTDATKSGNSLKLEMRVTNRKNATMELRTKGMAFGFYDDNGSYYTAAQVCIGDKCRNFSQLLSMNEYVAQQKIPYTYQGLKAPIPTDIPLLVTATIPKIKEDAETWVKGHVAIAYGPPRDNNASQTMYVEVPAFDFPSDGVAGRPNARRLGAHVVELAGAELSGGILRCRFTLDNGETTAASIAGGPAVGYTADGVALDQWDMASGTEIAQIRRRYSGQTVSLGPIGVGARSAAVVGLQVGERHIDKLAGLQVTFDGIPLMWRDVAVANAGNPTSAPTPPPSEATNPAKASPAADYLPYETFVSTAAEGTATGKRVVLEEIYFTSGSSELLASSHAQLDELAGVIAANPSLRLEVSGHTDDIGDAQSNNVLSQRRADEIKYYLLSKGIEPARITSIGYGEAQPLRPNSSTEDRQQNRRVELRIE